MVYVCNVLTRKVDATQDDVRRLFICKEDATIEDAFVDSPKILDAMIVDDRITVPKMVDAIKVEI